MPMNPSHWPEQRNLGQSGPTLGVRKKPIEHLWNKNINNVGKAIINHPQYHFYRWYVYHSQSWVVIIVSSTLSESKLNPSPLSRNILRSSTTGRARTESPQRNGLRSDNIPVQDVNILNHHERFIQLRLRGLGLLRYLEVCNANLWNRSIRIDQFDTHMFSIAMVRIQ